MHVYFLEFITAVAIISINCLSYVHVEVEIFKKNSVRRLTVLRGDSVFSSPPERLMTSDFEGFFIRSYSYLNS